MTRAFFSVHKHKRMVLMILWPEIFSIRLRIVCTFRLNAVLPDDVYARLVTFCASLIEYRKVKTFVWLEVFDSHMKKLHHFFPKPIRKRAEFNQIWSIYNVDSIFYMHIENCFVYSNFCDKTTKINVLSISRCWISWNQIQIQVTTVAATIKV